MFYSRTGKFHPGHYLVLVLKWLLITTWGRQEGWRHRFFSPHVKFILFKMHKLEMLFAGISLMTSWNRKFSFVESILR